jgi:acylphosphatase
MLLSLHIIIQGKVQGVFCRAQIKKYADQHNLKGTVQNLNNTHQVEIHIQGLDNNINQFQKWLKNNPGAVEIEKINIIQQSNIPQTTYSDFKIIH